LLGILNFGPFHQLLLDLKIQKLTTGKFSQPKKKKYINFTNSLKSQITKEKISQVSESLNQLKLLLFPTEKGDYKKFVSLQNERIKTDMRENRTKVRKHKFFLFDLLGKIRIGFDSIHQQVSSDFYMLKRFNYLLITYGPRNKDIFSGSHNFPNFEKVVFINLKILEQMNQDITADGKKFIVVDASSQVGNHERLPAILFATILEKYCKVNRIGYIPLHQSLKKSKANGIQTVWPYDGHFNENGQRIFGEAMFEWMQKL
jgi:hypothetical protein